jgi:hypothetical protein
VDQDKTNFENLCDLVLLYLGAAIKWLDTEYGTIFATKTEVDPVKLLSISDFVNAAGTVQRSAPATVQRRQLTAFPTEKASRPPRSDVRRHSGRRTQAAVVARAWLG